MTYIVEYRRDPDPNFFFNLLKKKGVFLKIESQNRHGDSSR